MVVQILWLSRSYDCPDLMVVQILWLSRSYDCPILMYVIFHILWLSRSYGRPHLMVVHILLLSTSYGLTLWLSGSYGYILWYLMVVRWHLMVVHVDGCPVDGCPLTLWSCVSRHRVVSRSSAWFLMPACPSPFQLINSCSSLFLSSWCLWGEGKKTVIFLSKHIFWSSTWYGFPWRRQPSK